MRVSKCFAFALRYTTQRSLQTSVCNRNDKEIRTFEEIPRVDNARDDNFDTQRISDRWMEWHREYGSIFRVRNENIEEVYCNSREDTEKLFRFPERLPFRSKVDGITLVKDILGLPDDILNHRGEEWYRLRKPLNELMLKNRLVWKHTAGMHEVAKDFVEYIGRKLDSQGEVPNFEVALNKCSFEMACSFSFNTRLGLLRDNVSSDVTDAFEGTQRMMVVMGESMYGSSSWKHKEKQELERSIKRTGEIFDDIINAQKNEPNFAETLLGGIFSRDELSEIEKVSLVSDLMLSSVETPSALAIYCLTLDMGVQEKLRRESVSLCSNGNEPPSGRDVDGMKYMTAFFKEANRLYPFTHSMIREFSSEIVLSGYRIPAGTRIINTTNSTQNRNPEYFPNPDKFMPERWLEREESKFVSTGIFGVGPRACPGRRLAMQGMCLLLTELLKNFRIEYHYKPMTSLFRLLGVPSEKCRFTFRSL